MALSPARIAQIEREDAERRMLREIDEWVALNTTTVTEARLPYVPEHMRNHRANVSSWERGLRSSRAKGYTGGGEDGPIRPNTMLVTRADGSQSIEPVPTRSRSRSTRSTATVATEHRTTAADLAPIGDSNH